MAKFKTRDDLIDELRETLPDDKRESFNDLLTILNDELKEAEGEAKTAQDERDDLQGELDKAPDEFDLFEKEEALQAVKDWMHDVLYLGKPMRDPRKILRIVEDSLGT